MWLGGGAETDAAELVNNGNSIATFDRIHLCEDPGKERFEFALQLFSKTPTGKILDTAHPLSYLLGQEPNPEMDIRSETVNRLPGGCSIVDPNIEGVNRHLSCK
jgi:hypothetical protein